MYMEQRIVRALQGLLTQGVGHNVSALIEKIKSRETNPAPSKSYSVKVQGGSNTLFLNGKWVSASKGLRYKLANPNEEEA